MTAERPLRLTAPEVRAVLDGRKTQTRQIITKARVFATPEQRAFTLSGADLIRAMQNADGFRRIEGDAWCWEADAFEWQAPHTRTRWNAHIGYAVGDRLWVREAWRASKDYDRVPPSEMSHWPVHYEADGAPDPNDELHMNGRLRPSIHMPRWASRITLEVTEVRVQRLQDLSEEDAKAEGVTRPMKICDDDGTSYTDGFGDLWESIHGSGAWDANPWVCALTFRRITP